MFDKDNNKKPSLVTAAARVLPVPRVLYGKGPANLGKDRAWNLLGQVLRAPATIHSWGWLCLNIPGKDPQCDFSDAADFFNTLKAFRKVMTNMGIKIGEQKKGMRLELNSLDDRKLDDNLASLACTVDFLFVVLPDKTPVYDRIKRQCDTKLGLINVCCIGQKLRGRNDQYFRNLALKINAKCGGCNQAVAPARLHFIAQNKTMVVGIDVTHPSPGAGEHSPSIAAVVANTDSLMGQWPCICMVQSESRQEMVSNLNVMIKSRLEVWKTRGKHGFFPENIIVFRDGVSEGQYQQVKEKELPLLRQGCEEVYMAAGQPLPRISIVIVTKRHHKRFYPVSEVNADDGSNCVAGTVIDRTVTEARNWDFYIMPHTALKGTAKPTYYFVVHDEIFRTIHRGTTLSPADTLQDITQSLSYISARSTKPVSVCAPTDYADLACERARSYLRHLVDSATWSESGMSGQLSRAELEERIRTMQEEIKLHEKTKDVMVYI